LFDSDEDEDLFKSPEPSYTAAGVKEKSLFED